MTDSGQEGTVCSKCDGNGWVVHPRADEPGQPDHIDCDQCSGDGFVYD